MGGSPGKRSGWKFVLKIDIPAFIAFSLFAGLIFFYLIPGFEETMKDRKRVLIQEITSSAYSLVEYYHSLELQGLIDSTEAKNEALSAISSIRYGEKLKDYLWITDKHPKMIVHPYRPDLNGKDLTQFRDPRGKLVFVEFVKAVSITGESYVDYMWQWNDDSTRVVSKLSYVRLFEPWGWIIGTGIYIDDVTREIRKMEFRALIISGIIGIVIIILLIIISNQSHKAEKRRSLAEEELKKSRELYRTLAEASSEGVILWSANGMQANKTILSWLGYDEREFISLKPADVFTGTEMITGNNPDDLYEELTARHYSKCSLRAKNGDLLPVHSDFSRIMLGDLRAVLVALRPATSDTGSPPTSMTMPLLNKISSGFFKVTYGRKSKFLFASEPALKILGFKDFQELELLSVDSFFADNAQLKALKDSMAAREDIVNRVVLVRRKDSSEFRAILNAVTVESDSGEIWYEGTIDPLAANLDPENTLLVDLAGLNGSMQYNKVAGFISVNELSDTFFNDHRKIAEDIEKADSAAMLWNIYLASRKLAVSMVMGQADPCSVSLYISSLADAICRRAIELCIKNAGDPPCRFAFLQTGSAGRREQTLCTDQDNAIIFDDVEPEKMEDVRKYFTGLGKRVNEMLSESGYRLCKGEKMAGNPLWCQPLDKWKQYFSGWIKNPGPSELLEMSIFFDFRICYGDIDLAEALRDYVKSDLKTNDIFFHHLASAWKQYTPLINVKSDKKTDIKRLIMPLTGIIRLYALKHGIAGFSSFERMLELYSGKHLDHNLLRDLIRAWKDLTSIRLNHQAEYISAGLEPDNHVDLRSINKEYLCYAEQAVLSINNLMLKASNDFYADLG